MNYPAETRKEVKVCRNFTEKKFSTGVVWGVIRKSEKNSGGKYPLQFLFHRGNGSRH